MWSIVFSAVSAFFGGGKNPLFWIAAVVLAVVAYFTFAPAISTVAGWLGWETKATLKKELEVAKKNVDTLTTVNEAHVVSEKVAEGTLENTQQSFEAKREAEVVTKKVVAKVLTEKAEKIKAIEEQHVDPLVEHREISLVHINSIWQTFCSFNDAPECSQLPPKLEPAA